MYIVDKKIPDKALYDLLIAPVGGDDKPCAAVAWSAQEEWIRRHPTPSKGSGRKRWARHADTIAKVHLVIKTHDGGAYKQNRNGRLISIILDEAEWLLDRGMSASLPPFARPNA